MADESIKHDPLDQLQDENELQDEVVERGADSDEAQAAEAGAVNIDTEIAKEATKNTLDTKEDPFMDKDQAGLEDDEEVYQAREEKLQEEKSIEEEEVERKHKNRESTSEKAKRSKRQSTSEKAKLAEEEKGRRLDPLRLRGKKYRAQVALVDKKKEYPVEEALELVKQTSYANFDAAVELHVKVKADAVRGTVVLPNGTGKTKRIAVADEETIEAISNGKLDFDVLLATPAQMPKLAKFAKVLGPKGLMPSPKAGTVTEDIEKAKDEIGGGRVEYRADKTGVVHLSIGRVSFPVEKLMENYKAVELILLSNKIQSVYFCSTMGPGIKVVLTK